MSDPVRKRFTDAVSDLRIPEELFDPRSLLKDWQEIVDLLGEITGIFSAITRFQEPDMELVVVDEQQREVLKEEDYRYPLLGTYCEKIYQTGESLAVVDGGADPEWRDAGAVVRGGYLSYLGIPIRNPDKSLFGTICIYDREPCDGFAQSESLLRRFGKLIEDHLLLITQTSALMHQTQEIHRLQTILPICIRCKNVRDDEGYWEKVDHYLTRRLGADLTHSLCPGCFDEIESESVSV